MYNVCMVTKNFDPETMTRATQSDIDRMWFRLWGSLEHNDVAAMTLNCYRFGMEPLDETQKGYPPYGYTTESLRLSDMHASETAQELPTVRLV